MNLIEWRDDFSVGIESVDYEHRELIGLINKVLQQIEQGEKQEDTLEYLGILYNMISSHFALEEKIMSECKYDEYEEHKSDHDDLMDVLRDLMDEYEDNTNIDTDSFAKRFSDWFTIHFMTRDARMHRKLHA